MSEQVFYKIRHRITGAYSKGGVYVTPDGTGFTWVQKGGKTWDTLGKLRSHITSHMSSEGSTDMSEWEVVEYHAFAKDVKAIHEVIDPKKLIRLLKS